MRTIKSCKWCGIEFEYDHWEERKYCSKKCGMCGAGRLRAERQKTKTEKFIAKNTDKHICACGCGEYIVITETHYSDNIPKYIHGHNARRDRERFNRVLICKFCGAEFEITTSYDKDYCSRKCLAEAMSQIMAGKGMVARFTNICEICGIEFITTYGDQRFCGNECRLVFFKTVGTGRTHIVSDEAKEKLRKSARKQWDVENRIKMSCIKLGIGREEWDGFAQQYCYKWDEKLRQQIRDQYNNCDFFSGLPEYICNIVDNKIEKLSVHHIDYNKMQGCEGHEWRLIPLSRVNHGRTMANRIFWERLIYYAIEYDKTYYGLSNNEISRFGRVCDV